MQEFLPSTDIFRDYPTVWRAYFVKLKPISRLHRFACTLHAPGKPPTVQAPLRRTTRTIVLLILEVLYYHYSGAHTAVWVTEEYCSRYTLPKTNSLPLKIGHPKRKFIFQPSIFSGVYFAGFVSGRGTLPEEIDFPKKDNIHKRQQSF